MKVLNDALSTVTAQAEAVNAAPTHTAAHDSINPLHHEVVLAHEGSTQDGARSPKTSFYYDGEPKPIWTRPFQHMLRQEPGTNQQNTIASPKN